MNAALDILKTYWRHTKFRPLQEEIINSILQGNDTVALLPTGGGKSVCYQIPALINDGICIVISPLVALMTDQVNALKDKGIKSIQLSGGLKNDEVTALLDNATFGNYKFLYLSPERLQQEEVQNRIKSMNVNLIAVDEAHCISHWGNDFRPAYKNINLLRELHPLVPIIALTATATPDVLKDTILELKLQFPKIFQDSFVRKNVVYQVFKEEDKLYKITQLLKNNQGTSIIYVRSRKMSVETSNHLNAMGLKSIFFHGGLTSKEKNRALQEWRNGNLPTIVATNAFGMGIDQPNVRFVIHIQIPESVESYFQEAGRAGRDGQTATAILLHSDYDKLLLQSQFIDSLPSVPFLKGLYKNLNNYFQIPFGEGEFSQHNFNFTQFCKVYKLNSLLAYNGLQSLDRLGVLQLSQEFGRKSILQFLVGSNQLLSYLERDAFTSIVGKTILRLYGGIFEGPTSVNLELVASKISQPISKIISELQKMETNGVLELNLKTTDSSITFLVPREDEKTINRISKNVTLQNEKKQTQVAAITRYIENESQCRSQQLVRYFGEITTEVCGICSVCVNASKKNSVKSIHTIVAEITEILKVAPKNSRQLTEALHYTNEEIIKSLRFLLENQKIKVNGKNEYYLN